MKRKTLSGPSYFGISSSPSLHPYNLALNFVF
jgi:hypothetical protein